MAVLTLPEVKEYLTLEDTSDDTQLEDRFMPAAEAAIAERVGPLEPTTKTTRVRPNGCRLVLDVTPVISVTSITSDDGTAITPVASWLDGDAGIITADTVTFADEWYDIVYEAGRTVCPANLRQAALELVRHFWATQGGIVGARQGEQDLPGSAYAFPTRVEQLLATSVEVGFA